MSENFDYANYITVNNVKRSDGVIFSKETFIGCESHLVPLIWNNLYNDPAGCLGYCVLENHDEGVYAKCWFNDIEYSQVIKNVLNETSEVGLSFSANRIKYGEKGQILSGTIRAVHVTPREDMFTYLFETAEEKET